MYTVLWLRFFLTWPRFFLPWLRFFSCFFLSCKANARVKLTKTGPHFSTLVVICVVRLLFVLFYVLFVCNCVLPPGDNQIAVNKYIISVISYIINITKNFTRPQRFSPSFLISAFYTTEAQIPPKSNRAIPPLSGPDSAPSKTLQHASLSLRWGRMTFEVYTMANSNVHFLEIKENTSNIHTESSQAS